ncbi:hypothetical protein B0H17DRAFT_1278881 [Mycena rosella]|uniref:Uncharacterized protein n=1 Tax=Mycena rosella TaxID=1033263 RepID=A0AAD7C2Y7_MYCRO|nr:hypothetical protein B0H17DRAFT_1278881 [Mycena rosella]
MQQGLLERVSRGSILEYHAFGIISQGRESGEHYLILGYKAISPGASSKTHRPICDLSAQVCRRFQHLEALQVGFQCLHRDRIGRRALDLLTGTNNIQARIGT